jgi:hypothetical protein
MEQQAFDASNILSKLRHNRPFQQTTSSTNFDRSGNQLDRGSIHSPAQPHHRNRFQRKERPEVRIELENEIDYLSGEVARLKRENKQLQMEKDDLEYRCADIKEKADLTISKLRNKLVALNKKFNEVGTSTKDKYVAKKNLQKTFSKGAGVLNITNNLPSTIPQNNIPPSIQSLTFSQFMKRSLQDTDEEYSSSSRNYCNQLHSDAPHFPKHAHQQVAAAPPGSGSAPEDSPYTMTSFDLPPQEEDESFHFHHPHSALPLHSNVTRQSGEGGQGQEGGARAQDVAPCPPGGGLHPHPDSGEEQFAHPPFMLSDDVDHPAEGSHQHLPVPRSSGGACTSLGDDDLPIVDIDLRST